jgi:hypothetical protein
MSSGFADIPTAQRGYPGMSTGPHQPPSPGRSCFADQAWPTDPPRPTPETVVGQTVGPIPDSRSDER